MATEVIDLIVRQRGARSASKALSDIGASAGQADKGLRALQGTLATIASGAIARSLVTAADTFTLLGNRTRVFATSAADARDRLEGIIEVANKSRAPIDATATVFQRLSIAQDAAGLSTEGLLDITETLAKAISVSGATAQEAEGALRQLSQGIAANRLSGQEFNSVIEQTPRIAQAIADSIGVEIGALRGLANQGKLTRDVIIQSFEAQADAIASEFEDVLPTIGQAFTVLQTSVTVFIGRLDQGTGISQKFANTILDIANGLLAASKNTEIWLPYLTDVGIVLAGIVALKAASAIQGIASAIIGLNKQLLVLAALNPLTAIVAAVGLATIAMNHLKDEVIEVGEQQFTLSALAGVFYDRLIPGVEAFVAAMLEIDFEFPSARQGFNNIVAGFNTSARVAGLFVDAVLDGFDGIGQNIAELFSRLPQALAAAASGEFSQAGAIMSGAFTRTFEDGFAGFGERAAAIANEEFGTDYVQFIENAATNSDILTEATERTTQALLEEAAAAEAARIAGEGGGRAETPKGVVELGLGESGRQSLQDDFDALRGTLDPAVELTNEYTDRITLLNEALAAGVINNEEFFDTQLMVNEAFAAGIAELDFEKLDGFTAAAAGAKAGFQEFQASLGSAAEIVSKGVTGALDTATDALVNFAATGKFSAKEFARSMTAQIAKVIIKLLILKAIQSAVGFAGGGGLGGGIANFTQGATDFFGGGRQAGGPVNPDQTFLVGEKGPELFTPRSTGTVIPNDMIGAGSQQAPPVVNVVNVQDPNAVADALNTQAGEEGVLNIIQNNPDVLREST